MKHEVEITVEMADIKLTAQWLGHNNTYQVLIQDTSELPSPHPTSINAIWTSRQLGAVLALAAPFEDENYETDTILKALYVIAEEVCKDLPGTLRPIP
jgi:hypothetical protein